MRSDRWPESRPSLRPSPPPPTLSAQRYTGAIASVGSNTQVSRLHYSLSETKTLVSQKYRQLIGRLRAYLLPIGLETAASSIDARRTNQHVWNTLANNDDIHYRVIKSERRTESRRKKRGSAASWNQRHNDWMSVGEHHRDGEVSLGALPPPPPREAQDAGSMVDAERREGFRPQLQRGCTDGWREGCMPRGEC